MNSSPRIGIFRGIATPWRQARAATVLAMVCWASLSAFAQETAMQAAEHLTTPALAAPQASATQQTAAVDRTLIATSDWGELPHEALWERDASVMVLIPAGEFIMGLDNPEKHGGRIQEAPAHTVWLSSYYIDKYEVTNEQYMRFVRVTGRIQPRLTRGRGLTELDRPVVGVTWDDAAAYAQWAGKDLPTEAQWEKAARGNTQFRYPWGNTWEDQAANTRESKRGTTAKPGSFPRDVSVFGVFDMAGNVAEWVWDYYEREYYRKSPEKNPMGPEETFFSRVYRGGDYYASHDKARVTARHFRPINQALEECGFRCVKNLKIEPTPTPRPTHEFAQALATPSEDPLLALEKELFAAWKDNKPLPAALTPSNIGGQAPITLVNRLPMDVSLTVVSTDANVIFYNRSVPALSKTDLSLALEKNMVLYVKIPATGRIVRTSPVFQSTSRPIMFLDSTLFLPSLSTTDRTTVAPPKQPEMGVYYKLPAIPWNRVTFFNASDTTTTLLFEGWPLAQAPEKPQTRFSIAVGAKTIWEEAFKPGTYTFRTLYLGRFETGAEPFTFTVDEKKDTRALLITENLATNQRIRVFTRELPPLKIELRDAMLGAIPRIR
jgi:iron(II)-dependent oxidoreductase